MGNKAQELTQIMQVLDNNVSIDQSSTEVDKGVSIGLMNSAINRSKCLVYVILLIPAVLFIYSMNSSANIADTLKEFHFVTNNRIHNMFVGSDTKFFTFHECSNILDKQKFGPSINMYRGLINTSYVTNDISHATYCLSASYCTRDNKLMQRMQEICPKILVVELDYNPRLGKDLLANSKVHYLLSNCRPQFFRPNQDICVPLSLKTPLKCAKNTDFTRRYVASFVGTIYVNSYGRHRYTLKWLNETSDMFIKFTCNGSSNRKRMKSHGSKYLRTACDRYKSSRSPSDYCYSLNSTFVLCPGGRQPASYRLLEALMVNSIPVPYYESFDSKIPMPFHRVVDWEQCTKVYAEILDVERLIQSDEKVITGLLKGCSNIYQSHLSSFEMMARTTNQELLALTRITASLNLLQ